MTATTSRGNALRAIGAQRVVVTLAAGNSSRQADLLAEATTLLD